MERRQRTNRLDDRRQGWIAWAAGASVLAASFLAAATIFG